MAYAFIMEFDGATLDRYDAVIEDMELGGRLAPGALFHGAGMGPNGLVVCDVWEDAAAFDAFAESQIGPLTAKHGVAPPRMRTVEGEVREGEKAPVGLMQVVTLPGVDADRFAAIDSAVLGPERRVPEGCVFHIGGPVGRDWVIVDYWTDSDAHATFLANQVEPAFERLGAAAPTIERFDVHNALTEQPINA